MKRLAIPPQVAYVTEDDLREFQLPIPGVWRKIMASKATPGLPAKSRDRSFPARTRVIGVIDWIAWLQVVYLKSEFTDHGVVKNEALKIVFVALGDTVNAFKGSVAGQAIDLSTNKDGTLCDAHSGTVWDARGTYRNGPLRTNLEIVAISDEYWFSWKAFHPDSTLVRLP